MKHEDELRKLASDLSLTYDDIARCLHKSPTWVSRNIRKLGAGRRKQHGNNQPKPKPAMSELPQGKRNMYRELLRGQQTLPTLPSLLPPVSE